MTWRNKPIHRLYAFALAAVFSLALAGCGGGGGAAGPTGPTDDELIATAQMAAKAAAGVAAEALAAVEANKSADLDSYIRASVANDNAQAALAAANAATTPAAAEAAQAAAEAASDDVQKYAGMVTAAHNALEAAKVELKALTEARAAAMAAYEDAKAALAAVAGQGDADSDSYNMAVAALAAAMKANQAAQDAETSDAAKAAQADAEAALADATKYAGMVASAHTEATALSTAQQAAMKAYTDAKAALAAAAADKDYDMASYTRAEDAVADAKAASDAAAAATTSEAAKAAQADAEAAGDAAAGFIAMIAQAKQDEADKMAAAAAKKAANDLALTRKAALAAEATSTVRPFDGTAYDPSDGADNTATNYGVTVKHTGSAVEVTVKDGHGDYDAKNDPKFSMVGDPLENGGHRLRREDGSKREVIVLHTDIEAPESVRFGTSGSGYTFDQDVDQDTSANDSYEVQSGDASKLGGSRIVSSDPGTKSLSQWTRTGDNADNVYDGTLDGASGKFRCQTSGGCVITTASDDDNTVTFSGTLWFTPNAGATVKVPDSDYLTYGFWVEITRKDGANASYNKFQTFATSSLAASTDLGSVTGTATYEGGAAGNYVHESKKEDGTLDTAISGRFTADVSLKAYFDATTTRTADTLEGTISNFDLRAGPENNAWNVNVSAATIANDNGFTGNASGMAGNNGSLSGRFHGTGKAGDATVAPPVLVGEFNANFVNGVAVGAFGARKQK